ncbi:MAG: metallophosphoesterase [Clostridia bacterium]|nr:metallophosphoesterase [Clostridia bacterium]
MRTWRIMMALVLVVAMVSVAMATPVSAASPSMRLDRTVYAANDTITVTYSGTDTNDWTGIYPAGLLPGSGQNSLLWQYTVGSGTITFSTASLAAGEYTAYLCDNDGYKVIGRYDFTVRSTDTANYGVKNARLQASVVNGKSSVSVMVTPSSAATLTYRLYWTKDGVRLDEYLHFKEMIHGGEASFVMTCNDCLVMPDEANGIEVAVLEGYSTSYYLTAPNKLKAPASSLRYTFQVLTDLHVSSDLPAHIPNLKAALRDVAANAQNSIGIFTCGDNTDRGTQAQYDLLLATLAEMKNELTLPPIRFAIGNHDEVYGGTYDEEVQRFIANLGAPGLYYAVDLNGTRFLILGSEEQSTAGTISDTQIAWVKNQLAQTDPTKPVFLFLHQPLKDTVSGTLTWTGNAIQRWYLGASASEKLHAVLKNYPNAVLFSGHTHSSFDQLQPFLYGEGVGASFVNAASTAYLWGDDNLDFQGSQGLYVEVYDDYVLVKGRDFTHGKWHGAAQFLIPVHGGTATYEGDVISKNVGDWSFDSGVMQVTTDAYATTIYNTNGAWPSADYTLKTPITFDPDSTNLYVDMVLENDASTNIYLQVGASTYVSLTPYLPKLEKQEGSDDLYGNGRRVRGAVDLRDVDFVSYNNDGTVTLKQVRVYASGAANAALKVYDMALVSDRSEKTVSLMNADTLSVLDAKKKGGYTYQNGKLTVRADTADGYAVRFTLDETYDVEALQNLLIRAQSTAAFDVTLTVSTAASDVTFGLAADFWPTLCEQLDGGKIPAGNYDHALDLYSGYTFNGVAPTDGFSTIHDVTVTLGGAGSLTLDGLQLSSAQTVQTIRDDVAKEEDTTFLLGDVDGNGEVTTSDIRLVLKHTGGASLTEAQLLAADVNGDGKITTVDVRDMLRDMLV